MDERVNVAMLNPDRADVIIPAGHIYLSAMEWAHINTMLVPDIGLKDGMLQTLFERHYEDFRPASERARPHPTPRRAEHPWRSGIDNRAENLALSTSKKPPRALPGLWGAFY